jgi:uncharacterized protein (DUF2141 family)
MIKTGIILFLLVSGIGVVAMQNNSTPFSLKVKNVKHLAMIKVAFYKASGDFPDEKAAAFAREFRTTEKGEVRVTWRDIPYGEYAMAIYLDVNGNNKMDTNLVGYPAEPFGFSRNVKPRFSAPKFGACKFYFDASHSTFEIVLLD